MKENTFQCTVIILLGVIVLLSIFNAGGAKERRSGKTHYSFMGKNLGSLGTEKQDGE